MFRVKLPTDRSSQNKRFMPKIPDRSSSRCNSRTTSAHSLADVTAQQRHGQAIGAFTRILEPPRQSAMPRPLSPRRSPVPEAEGAQIPENEEHNVKQSNDLRESGIIDAPQHSRTESEETSWYNGNGEEPPSRSSSPNHSVTSVGDVRKRDLRNGGNTEVEFDAALDAAVEAAYNDGYEPYDGSDPQNESKPSRSIRHSDPIADDERSFAQREARIEAAQHRISLRQRNKDAFDLSVELSDEEDGIGTDEEDRLLAEDTEDFDSSVPLESAKPRESDSSGFSGRTWGSSAASSLNTAGTSLSTVDENASMPALPPKESIEKYAKAQKSSPPPPPPPPVHTKPGSFSLSKGPPLADFGYSDNGGPAVTSPMFRERRLSVGKAKKLKIETAVLSTDEGQNHSKDDRLEIERFVTEPPKTAPVASGSFSAFSPDSTSSSQLTNGSRSETAQLTSPYPSPFIGAFPLDAFSPATPVLTSASPRSSSPTSSSKTERPPLREQASSFSTRKNGLLSAQSEGTEISPGSPASFAFPLTISPMLEKQGPILGSTPAVNAFGLCGAISGAKVKFFENEIHSESIPGLPNPELTGGPRALEPCPESTFLRPFWLMRCFHQTLVNSKGAYVSTRLFVPHDAWKVKNAKIKGTDEKIANFDLLTAALLKLSSADTLDAEALLDELQAFEAVMDQAEANLTKKLGNEVGLQGVSTFFKNANASTMSPPGTEDATTSNSNGTNEAANTASTSSRTGSKLFKLSRLRNKSSSTNLASTFAAAKEIPKDGASMASLPMTTSSAPLRRSTGGSGSRSGSGRGRQSSTASVQIDGPNGNYASALARLCDAVQILGILVPPTLNGEMESTDKRDKPTDQIARQAEDPGLKRQSPTQVGLELAAQRSSQFFAFFVCRFVLQDLTLLTEKFLKRASEWVVAS